MRRSSIPSRAAPAALVAFLVASCGPPPEPCLANCPPIGGTFAIDSSQATGVCDFMPLIVTGALNLVQSADTTAVSTTVRDTVSNDNITLSGDVFLPAERDPEGTLASFSMVSQFVRPAFEDDPRLVTLQIILAGSVRERAEDDRRVLDGSLTTTDVSPGAGETCSVRIIFSGTDRTTGSGDDTTG